MISFKMKKNNIPNLRKRLIELQNAKFSVGYFPENGTHESSGLGYAWLFAIQSFGSPSNNIPARPVLNLSFDLYNPIGKNLTLKNGLKKYFSKIGSKTPPVKLEVILEKVAGKYVQDTRKMFGNSGILTKNRGSTIAQKGFDAPLIETGDLKMNLSYRINGGAVITPK